MKITEILVESQQLDEGPILNKIGSGIGKVAGTVAKGVGAVAGGVAGLGSAIKKGFQAGKATVAGAGDDPAADAGAAPAANAAAPAAKAAPKTKTAAPAGGGTAAPTAKTPAGGGTAAPAANTAAPAADPASGAAPAAKTPAAKAPASGGTAAPAADPASGAAPAGSMYSQVKANIDKLDKKGKQRILAALQKEVGAAPTATAKPAAGAAPADSGAMANMAGQLAKAGAAKPNTMANTPTSKTNTAKPGNPNAAPAAETPAEPAAPAKPAKPQPGAATTAPSGEKVIANPVATVGTKRATNVGQQTFDTQTGKALPGQSINAIRKKAEYGTGALGAARKRIKAGAPAAQESIDADRRNIMGTSKPAKARETVSESFSLFRKR